MPKLNATACTLLGFLHDRPMTGWDLSEVVQLTIGSFWNVTRSQVYRELRTLEAGDYVVGGERGAREKRAYTITEKGRVAFRDWISLEPGREVARYPLLVTVWFGDHLPEDELEWFLRVHYQRHSKRREFLQQVEDELDDHSTPAARALRFGLYYEDAVVRWFETLPWFGGTELRSRKKREPRPRAPRKPSDFMSASDRPKRSPKKASAKKNTRKKTARKVARRAKKQG